MKRNAFTLVEIMIVVAIIGILAAIAIPNLSQSRKQSQTKGCIQNMKQIEGALERYAAFNNVGEGTAVAMNLLCGAGNEIKTEPRCPAKSTVAYAAQEVGVAPVCPNVGDFADHVLP